MLARVVERARGAVHVDEVVVATTDVPADDDIVAEAQRLGVAVFRGSENDVLSRYVGAARAFDATSVVRITSDCPLIDPALIDEVVAAFEAADAAYATNALERTYPHGLDVEVASRAALEDADVHARLPYQRAHVMPFLYEQPNRYRVVHVRTAAQYAWMRWTVDTQRDMDFVRAVYERLPTGLEGWRDVVDLLEAEPALLELNRGVSQKLLEEG